MKLLKLIPAAAIVLIAFTTFEAKADEIPSGWTKKNKCTIDNATYYLKLQKTDTPASYGVTIGGDTSGWVIDENNNPVENVSYDCATKWYQWHCDDKGTGDKPTCTM